LESFVHASQLVALGTALVVAGLLATALPRGRYGLPLALFAVANVAAGVGNLVSGDRWSGAGNLAAACYLGGLWWHGQRQRRAGDPAWLREAMAADAAARARRWAELGRDPAGRPTGPGSSFPAGRPAVPGPRRPERPGHPERSGEVA
jgi:hypothetical protein